MTAEIVPARMSRLQRGWLIVYWLAPPVVVFLMLQALIGFEPGLFVAVVALVLGSAALVLGLVFATRLARLGADDVVFIKGTTTVRVIALAWLLISFAMVSGVIIAVAANVEVESVDWSGGFASTAGSLSILAMLGPGYAEYREALKQARADREHAA